MKIYFNKLDEKGLDGVVWDKTYVCFAVTRPIIVQPSEIMKVPLNLILGIEKGCTLIINTHPDLADRAAEIFPSSVALNDTTDQRPFELAVRNSGRNPLNLMPGELIGRGHIYPTMEIEPTPFSIELEVPEVPKKSSPSKKNVDVKFEIN